MSIVLFVVVVAIAVAVCVYIYHGGTITLYTVHIETFASLFFTRLWLTRSVFYIQTHTLTNVIAMKRTTTIPNGRLEADTKNDTNTNTTHATHIHMNVCMRESEREARRSV